MTYGAAAVDFTIFGSFGPGKEDLEFGGLGFDIFKAVPPQAKYAWPVSSFTISMTGKGMQGHRLRISSQVPTLDNWDRAWYMWLCLEAQSRINDEERLRDPVGVMRVDLPTQGLEFSFRPLVIEEARPTRGMLVDVLEAVNEQVVQPFGAREFEFQWIDGGGRHLGVGYLERKKGGNVGVEPVAMSGNVTRSLTDVRGMNGTGPIMDFRGSNTTVGSKSVITA